LFCFVSFILFCCSIFFLLLFFLLYSNYWLVGSDDRSSLFRFFATLFFSSHPGNLIPPFFVIMKSSILLSLATLGSAMTIAHHEDDKAAADKAAAANNGSAPAVSCRNDICYSAVVPEATAQSGDGPVWFQIYAPTKFSWVALGTGNTMADTNMFIMYQDGEGNVTLSNRQATGHSPPTVVRNGSNMTLLAGSGVKDGVMIANFRCDNCTTWKQDGQLDFTANDEGTPMVGAWSEGDALNSTDVSERIGKHTGSVRIFKLDLSTATTSQAGNPFAGDWAVPAPLVEAGNATTGTPDGDSAAMGRSGLASAGVALAALLSSFALFM
jgi:hypothetical protein